MSERYNLSNIKIIDCTVRDGGHLNKWDFSADFVSRVYSAVAECDLYCAELGYVTTKGAFPDGTGLWRFSPEEALRSVISPGHHTKIAVMGDIGKIQLDDFIDKEDSIIDLVRLAFYPGQIRNAIGLGEQVMDKGYEVCLNLMAITHYSNEEIEEAIGLLYNSRIENVVVSDSFGSLLPNQVYDLVRAFKKGTGKNIGFHPHNNLELAFANTIRAVEGGASLIDATIYGMGRGAGNLPLEVLLSYISAHEGGYVNMIPLLELIEDEFITLKQKLGWGYSLPYLLSGMLKCHPNYASELVKKHSMSMRQIWPVLVNVSKAKPISFDKKILEKVMADMSDAGHKISDAKEADFSSFKTDHVKLKTPPYLNRHKGRDFLILAQGPSLKKHADRIREFAKENNLIVLGANYLEGLFVPDYHAFSNFKRFARYVGSVNPNSRLLLGAYFSEGIIRKYTSREFEVIEYVDDPTVKFGINDGIIQTNCGTVSVLLIGVAMVMGARKIYVAGLDGYKLVDGSATHFYDEKEAEKGRELMTTHIISKKYLDEIQEYQMAHAMEPFAIITPTSYSGHYKKIEGFGVQI